jgi:peptidoglycan/LPS O-acetylase OafA/YrhL
MATAIATTHPGTSETAARTIPVADATPRTSPRLWRAGLGAGVVAAAATTATALAADAAGVDVAVDGEQIPAAGFAQLTMVGALIGLLLARVLSRRARHPQRTFVRTTVVLTALSILPDVVADAPTATRVLLAATHVVAAAIVIPALASRLEPSRVTR